MIYLSDFRPKSFEYNGMPLDITSDGIVYSSDEIVPANTAYNSGNRRTLISITSTFDIVSGNIENLIDGGTTFVTLNALDNTPDGNFVYFTFASAQEFDRIKLTSKNWQYTPVINFYCSENNIDWIIFATTRLENTETISDIKVSLPTGDFKYFKFGSLSEDTYDKGDISKLEFNIIDKKILTPIIPKVDSTGTFDFENTTMENTDSSGNPSVVFNMKNNPSPHPSEYKMITMTGPRLSNGLSIPSNTQFHGYLGTDKAIFCSDYIYAKTFIQTDSGLIKFKDSKANEWRDLSYLGEGATIDSKTYPAGLFVENSNGAFEAIITSSNISAATSSVSIDDTTPSTTTVYSSDKTQTELDAKVDSSRVLTDVPSGAVFTDTITVIDDTTPSTTTVYSSDKTQTLYNETQVRSGTTPDRPTGVVIGTMYFDTDLNMPIWWNGTDWVDATGTVK